MPEVTSCPSCSRQLRVPDTLLGKAVKCPSCGTNFIAGGTPSAPAYEDPPPQQEAPPDQDSYDDSPEDDRDSDDRPRRGRRRRSRRGRGGAPHRGGLILALGIIGLVMLLGCGFLTLPLCLPAWLMGNHDLRQIRDGRMDSEGEGTTQAGRICGIIGTIMGGLVYLFGCLYILIVIIAVAANGPPR